MFFDKFIKTKVLSTCSDKLKPILQSFKKLLSEYYNDKFKK